MKDFNITIKLEYDITEKQEDEMIERIRQVVSDYLSEIKGPIKGSLLN